MKLGYIILYVADVPKTIAFWERAFALERRFVDERGGYGELDTGDARLAFASHAHLAAALPFAFRATEPGAPPPGFEVALLTDDVAAALARAVEAGAQVVMQPTRKPWGQEVAYVRDLDGNLVELCTPMS